MTQRNRSTSKQRPSTPEIEATMSRSMSASNKMLGIVLSLIAASILLVSGLRTMAGHDVGPLPTLIALGIGLLGTILRRA